MGRFVLVECDLWTDPDFLALTEQARLLFLWSWTNPRSTICGLYEVSLRAMEKAINEDPRAALRQLAEKPMVKYDPDNEVIWVVNRARYANRSPKVAKAMQREVLACPDSPLLEEFIAMYGTGLLLAHA